MFFSYHWKLSRSKLPQTESPSSLHSFQVSLWRSESLGPIQKLLFSFSATNASPVVMALWLRAHSRNNLTRIKQAFLCWKAPLRFCVFYTSTVAKAFGERFIFLDALADTHSTSKAQRGTFSAFLEADAHCPGTSGGHAMRRGIQARQSACEIKTCSASLVPC